MRTQNRVLRINLRRNSSIIPGMELLGGGREAGSRRFDAVQLTSFFRRSRWTVLILVFLSPPSRPPFSSSNVTFHCCPYLVTHVHSLDSSKLQTPLPMFTSASVRSHPPLAAHILSASSICVLEYFCCSSRTALLAPQFSGHTIERPGDWPTRGSIL